MKDHDTERSLPRDQRQELIARWVALAFGGAEATSVQQRGLRLLEEAIEAFQACGCDEAIAHRLVAYVFARPPGEIGQELGGVAVTTLALAAAAGLSADEEEAREIHRVFSKPIREFTARNASKNAAGFKIVETGAQLPRNRDLAVEKHADQRRLDWLAADPARLGLSLREAIDAWMRAEVVRASSP